MPNISVGASESVSAELVAASTGVAAGLTQLGTAKEGAKGPAYQLVEAGVEVKKSKPQPSVPINNTSAVGGVMVNIQQGEKRGLRRKSFQIMWEKCKKYAIFNSK